MEPKDVLLNIRRKHNLSQDEMAEKLYVTRQVVSRWEDGETSHESDGRVNDRYYKWCYIDGVHKYIDMEALIADVVPRWNWGTPEHMSNWLRNKLMTLEYWKK